MQKTCLIIPCFNEAARLETGAFVRYLHTDPEVDFLFVDDGSTDGTAEILRRFAEEHSGRVRCLVRRVNRGKADAVRRGALAALDDEQYGLIGYMDADLSTPLSQIIHLRAVFTRRKRCRLVLGSRFRHMGARIVRDPVRHYCGRVFSTFASMLLDLPVYDTQCGAKMMRREIAADLFAEPFYSRWLFDVELLARMINRYGRRSTLKTVVELPLLDWMEKRDSKLTAAALFTIPVDLLRIRLHYFW